MSNVRTRLSALLCVAALAAACGGSPTQPTPVDPGNPVPPIDGGSGPPSRTLEKTSFMAFGDSITAGTVTTFNGLLRIVIAPQSYPYKLKDLLAEQHADQQIEVYNEGLPNEWAADGVTRLPDRLTADSPQVLLLLEGVNDINNGAGIDPTIANLQTMIQEARNRGLVVFVGTLLPQRAGSKRAYAPGLIQPFNEQLKTMAAANDATLVDLYTPFAANLSLLGPDGLHPTAAGYTKMAEIWAEAIDEALEEPLPTLTNGASGSRLRATGRVRSPRR